MLEIVNNFINGEFAEPHNKEYLDIYEPATGSGYGKVADSSSHDINRAVESAKDAFPYWSELSMVERADYLKKIAAEIKNRSNILAKYESRDTGKPIILASEVDIPRASENFNFFANFSENFYFLPANPLQLVLIRLQYLKHPQADQYLNKFQLILMQSKV